MKCNACGKEADEFVVLSVKRKDGSLVSIMCVACAENSPEYCKKHERAHMGFMDGSTACLSCIEEIITEKESEGFNVWGLFKEKLPAEEVLRLLDWVDFSVFATGDPEGKCVWRAVVTKALRSNQEIEEVIREVLEKESVDPILPFGF